jgi:cobyric acid synthase
MLREKTTEIWINLKIRDYRNTVLAHNDRSTLISESKVPKHFVTTPAVLELLDASRSYIAGIIINVCGGRQSVSISVNPKLNGQGDGERFVNKLRQI